MELFPSLGSGGAERWTVHLYIPEPMVGLTLQVPHSFQFEASRPSELIVNQNQERVLVNKAEGKVDLIFKAKSHRDASYQ